MSKIVRGLGQGLQVLLLHIEIAAMPYIPLASKPKLSLPISSLIDLSLTFDSFKLIANFFLANIPAPNFRRRLYFFGVLPMIHIGMPPFSTTAALSRPF